MLIGGVTELISGTKSGNVVYYPGAEGEQYAYNGITDFPSTEIQITGRKGYSGVGKIPLDNSPMPKVLKFAYNIKPNTWAKIRMDNQGVGAHLNKRIGLSTRTFGKVGVYPVSVQGAYWNPSAQHARIYYSVFGINRTYDYAY